MNVEQFHAMIKSILDDVEAHDFPELLKQLTDALQNRVNDPAHPGHGQAADNYITKLRNVLPLLRTNSFPAAWKQAMEEYKLDNFVGEKLLAWIEGVFTQNAITHSIALKEIKEAYEVLAGDVEALKKTHAAFMRFTIPIDDVAPGTTQMGVLIPRYAVHDGLSEFGSELRRLARVVFVFQEISGAGRSDPALKSIASSDFSIAFILDWETARLIAKVIGDLIETYKVILKLKKQIEDLKESEVPAESLSGLVEHANSRMASKVKAITEEIVTNFPDGRVEERRKRELHIEVEGALGEIATRIDKGFNFEIRGRMPDASTVSDPEQLKVREAAMEVITAQQNKLEFIKPGGEPILTLPGIESAPADSGP